MLKEREGTSLPPNAFHHASKEYKDKLEKEKQERRNKPARIAPETKREILRMGEHPPPRRGPNTRVEKKPYLGFEKPDFLKKIAKKRNRGLKAELDSARDDIETDRSKFEEVQFSELEKPIPPPKTVHEQAMKDLRDDTSHEVHVCPIQILSILRHSEIIVYF